MKVESTQFEIRAPGVYLRQSGVGIGNSKYSLRLLLCFAELNSNTQDGKVEIFMFRFS